MILMESNDDKQKTLVGLRVIEGGWWSIAAGPIFSIILFIIGGPPRTSDHWSGSLVSILLAMATVAILAAIDVRRRRKFGRIATLVLSYFLVLIEALLLLPQEGDAKVLAMGLAIPSGISVWAIWYLTRPHVKEAFGVGKKPASLPPENPVNRAEQGDAK